MVWPFCAPTVTWFSYSPVECLCNTLCSLSVWDPDWEPIYRHYPSTRACSWIQPPPPSEPRRHSFPDSGANVFEFKTLTTTQDTSLKGGVMQQHVCSPGSCFEFQHVQLWPPQHTLRADRCCTLASCHRTNEVILLHPCKEKQDHNQFNVKMQSNTTPNEWQTHGSPKRNPLA